MIDIHRILRNLAAKRPVFHSEADFQHALAWELHSTFPNFDTRLELPMTISDRDIHLDIQLSGGDRSLGIELKYKTRALSLEINGEWFRLKDQAAQDIARYDFIKDLHRLEELCLTAAGMTGLAVFLTNDSAYWKPPRTRSTVDAAFRLHEGREAIGRLAWGNAASAGTRRGREEPITLMGTYRMRWMDYSRPTPSPRGTFRYLAVSVSPDFV